MSYPKHIPGTWQFSGDWLGSYRLIAENEDLLPTLPASEDITCPICEYPGANHLSLYNLNYKLCYWCPECGTVWQWYVARCPDCDFLVTKRGCEPGMVRCTGCGMEMEQEFVQELNELPEFHNEEEE